MEGEVDVVQGRKDLLHRLLFALGAGVLAVELIVGLAQLHRRRQVVGDELADGGEARGVVGDIGEDLLADRLEGVQLIADPLLGEVVVDLPHPADIPAALLHHLREGRFLRVFRRLPLQLLLFGLFLLALQVAGVGLVGQHQAGFRLVQMPLGQQAEGKHLLDRPQHLLFLQLEPSGHLA